MFRIMHDLISQVRRLVVDLSLRTHEVDLNLNRTGFVAESLRRTHMNNSRSSWIYCLFADFLPFISRNAAVALRRGIQAFSDISFYIQNTGSQLHVSRDCSGAGRIYSWKSPGIPWLSLINCIAAFIHIFGTSFWSYVAGKLSNFLAFRILC